MAARLNTIGCHRDARAIALYDQFETYWQNGGYKKISDIIFAEWHIFIVSNLWYGAAHCDKFQSRHKTISRCKMLLEFLSNK